MASSTRGSVGPMPKSCDDRARDSATARLRQRVFGPADSAGLVERDCGQELRGAPMFRGLLVGKGQADEA
jgi:hypothetical protein